MSGVPWFFFSPVRTLVFANVALGWENLLWVEG